MCDAVCTLEDGAAIVPDVYGEALLTPRESLCSVKVHTSGTDKDLSLQAQRHLQFVSKLSEVCTILDLTHVLSGSFLLAVMCWDCVSPCRGHSSQSMGFIQPACLERRQCGTGVSLQSGVAKVRW